MLVIGTAGHVDHGKSTLVQALTGIDPDRLEEEKRRGMTIDLGFARLVLPSGREASIVDVPGHERFVHTMLAGASGIDLALLVVAADEGIMPQTREHVAILELLGISQAVVAITKRDLADDEWLGLVDVELAEFLQDTPFGGAPRIPVSARTGEGLDALLDALDRTAPAATRAARGLPRLPVDRVFSVPGFGTVVTGTLDGDGLATGDEVEVLPGAIRSRIRSLQRHGVPVDHAGPGTRLAVSLPGIEPARIQRGHVLVRPGTMTLSRYLDCWIRVLPDGPDLRHNQAVTVHTGAAHAAGTARVLESGKLEAGASGWVQLRLATPLPCWHGDRLVLRSGGHTVAGGRVVRTAAPRIRRRDAAALATLAILRDGDPATLLLERIQREQPFSRRSLDPGAAASLEELMAREAVLALGDWVMTPDWLATMTARARALVESWHQAHPLRAGLERETLRTRLGLLPAVFSAMLDHWQAARLLASPSPGAVALPDHQPWPAPGDEARALAWAAALDGKPFAPEPPAPLEPELLAWLQRQGRVEVTPGGVVFSRPAWDRIVALVQERISQDGSITVATIRDMLGTSRRYALAIGDHLDGLHITRRDGDVRVLAPGRERSRPPAGSGHA